MRHIFLFILFSGFCLFAGFAQAEDLFFDSLYDVPVMEGLSEIPDQSFSFDKPDGRISQAAAVVASGTPKSAVFGFYDTALGQMGWEKQEQGIYTREGEKLTLSADEIPPKSQEKQGASLIIRFLLEPAQK